MDHQKSKRVPEKNIYICFIVQKEMAPHSRTLAWKIPWTEETGRQQSMGSQRVGHDWMTSLHSLHSFHTLSLEKEMATHSSVLAWKIPEMGEPGGLLSVGLHRVGHNWSYLAADVFLELSCFFDDPSDVGNLFSGSSAFSNTSFNIWRFTVHVLLKPGLENFGHFFTSV